MIAGQQGTVEMNIHCATLVSSSLLESPPSFVRTTVLV